MTGVILVSNRLPVTVRAGQKGRQQVIRSSGGLIAGLGPVHARGGLWIGDPGEKPDQKTAAALARQRLLPVPVTDTERRGHYQGYSNSALWPLFHYLTERCEFSTPDFEAYRRVNTKFAECIARQADEDALIWVHDYQLMLVPQMLRERLPRARIGFFLHIPFPASDVFRILPQRQEILRGLLGADVIGVHTYDYAGNLSRSFRRIMGLEVREGVLKVAGRDVQIGVHPLGVDVQGIRSHAFSPAAEDRLGDLRRAFKGYKVILGVDRLDYTKGLTLKLQAFRRLLARSAAWRDRVVLVQVAVPTRSGIESYRAQKAEVERTVGEINGLYDSPDRLVPVNYFYRSVSMVELGALYRLADVALVTPVRDGLNLVAKEYVACRDDGSGVLVLSEFAGAASEMGESLRVNPWDTEGTADAMAQALDMGPEEQEARMGPMHARVIAHDVHHWAREFLQSLEGRPGALHSEPPLVAADVLAANLRSQFAGASRLLLFLDYDGTLREFTARYEDATPTDEILSLLARLGSLRAVDLYIVSGRGRSTLSGWFRGVPVSLVSDHGAWVKSWGQSAWRALGAPSAAAWKVDVLRTMESFAVRTPGARIEKKQYALVWHFRESDPATGEWQARELASVLEQRLAQSPVEVITGARVVEVRQQGIDKGRTLALVRRRTGNPPFVLVAGDDATDEDMFEAAGPNATTVRVGSGPSAASVAVDTPLSFRTLLALLAAARENPSA